jgi:hypothetical protein
MATWGAMSWAPTDDDKVAATKLHIQLVSRITTQRLGYLEGEEKTALTSVYALFDKARDIAAAHPNCRHFEALTWHVLNVHVRPFTAKWHGQSERGKLAALDATDEFRADLNALQPLLQRFDHLLTYIRDGAGVPPLDVKSGVSAPPPRLEIEDELKEDVVSGIRTAFSGFKDVTHIDAINKAEETAISNRRRFYRLEKRSHTAALAMSGGGIRSATFSLGVLVALAQRDLLPQFDYLSTVSGGGYLGSFLSVFLQSSAAHVGLESRQIPFKRDEGEAAALRHIRHHSKYLAVGSMWERIKMFGAQLNGVAWNAVAVLWMVTIVVAVELWIRSVSSVGVATMLSWALWLLAIGGVLSLLILRFAGRLRRHADVAIAVPAAVLVFVLVWKGLFLLQEWWVKPPTLTMPAWLPSRKEMWVGLAGAVPVVAPALGTVFPGLLTRFGGALVGLSVFSAPVFLLGVYLVLHEHKEWLMMPVTVAGIAVPSWAAIAAVGFLLYMFVFDINATSPHRHYRRKLAQAYLIQPVENSNVTFNEDVPVKLSDLGKDANAVRAPYPLINCALNVPASSDIGMQGRLTDFFLFSPAYCGSPLIGYWPTSEWEARDKRLDVGTAMAISGAAAAPQMGLGTIKRFSFWLALLNVRLGYWARRPGVRSPAVGAPGVLHLVKEMLGSMNEKGPWINLSDGGHIENLGVFELLRRRCKYIVAIDGEEDQKMTFHGLTTLQRLAAIDLGVSIEVDLDDLRLTDKGFSRSHFRLCRIRYPKGHRGSEDEFGYLLYVKLSLTGNEGEFLRRYRLDEPAFPHHSTADQFFSEAQFEAYRSLGEHIGNKLFLRAVVGKLADPGRVSLEEWFHALGRNLLEPTTRVRQ